MVVVEFRLVSALADHRRLESAPRRTAVATGASTLATRWAVVAAVVLVDRMVSVRSGAAMRTQGHSQAGAVVVQMAARLARTLAGRHRPEATEAITSLAPVVVSAPPARVEMARSVAVVLGAWRLATLATAATVSPWPAVALALVEAADKRQEVQTPGETAACMVAEAVRAGFPLRSTMDQEVKASS